MSGQGQVSAFFYVIAVLVTSLNVCLSKPSLSAAKIEYNITTPIIRTLGANTTTNSVLANEDNDYRNNYATLMLSYMNFSVNPCHDFYEYACGNWKNIIKEHASTTKRSNILDNIYKLQDIVENILETSDINQLAPEYAAEFELARKFYHNCLEADIHPLRAVPEYLAVLREIGGFPAVDKDWNSDNFHWLAMSAHLSNYGIKSFVNEDILPEYPFPPYFRTPHIGFDIKLNSDTIKDNSSNAYRENENRIRDILTIYGVEGQQINDTITETFNFLTDILKVIERFGEDENECEFLSKFVTESDVTALKENWRIYYDIAWNGKAFDNVTRGFEDCCRPCSFLYEKLDKICEQHKRAAANYLSLKFLFHLDARLKDKKFQKDFCISNVKSTMKYIFDHLYMKLYFSDDLRQEIKDIVKKIRHSLRKILQDASWLDEATRNAALLKESTIGEQIGRYEDPILTKLLIGELQKLQFLNGSFEVNNLNLRKFRQQMERFNGLNFEKLSNTSKPLELLVGMQPNSFYYNVDNSIYVMAGTLMAPIYNRAWPSSLKFGTLGYVIGHEFTHGFDTVGANYDENGQENYWWSNKSAKVFAERADCYIDHYNTYLIPEINRNINGLLTKNENIADGGGLREAFMAYQRYFKNLTEDTDLVSTLYKAEQVPGIDLTPEQVFFLGFAQLWCASYKEEHYWEELANVHVVDKYRVLGALSNNIDFANVYNCSVGSKMNPSLKKCKVW